MYLNVCTERFTVIERAILCACCQSIFSLCHCYWVDVEPEASTGLEVEIWKVYCLETVKLVSKYKSLTLTGSSPVLRSFCVQNYCTVYFRDPLSTSAMAF